MGTRVVLDTNILVSALGWRGAPHEILRSCLDHRHQLLLAAELVRPGFKVEIIEEDPSDNRVLECALAGRAQVIVSGDGHLLSLEGFEIPILRPQIFQNLYNQD
jgi:predicted nucleic acid-binding protein